jgi:hypothetical protein
MLGRYNPSVSPGLDINDLLAYTETLLDHTDHGRFRQNSSPMITAAACVGLEKVPSHETAQEPLG